MPPALIPLTETVLRLPTFLSAKVAAVSVKLTVSPARTPLVASVAKALEVCLLGLQAGSQLNGPDTVRAIMQRHPGTKVLVLAEVTTPETLSQLIRSGVAGVTHQGQSVAQIAKTLDAIEAGQNVLDPGPLQVPARDTNRLGELSPREREILARIAGGQSTRQMSCAMNITVDTVRTYVKNVLTKLGAHSRLQLAALASRDGLLIEQEAAAHAFPRG